MVDVSRLEWIRVTLRVTRGVKDDARESAPMIEECSSVICELRQWQGLAGAITGGVFALCVALLVSYLARRREERAAGMLVVGALVQFIARNDSLKRVAAKKAVPEADHHKWLSEKLTQSRPKVSPLFDASLYRLSAAHPHLAAHLELFKVMFADMDENLDRIADDYKDLHEKGKALRPQEVMEADARIASRGFRIATLHADCAACLIAQFAFSHFPTWNRIRRWLRPSTEERTCQQLLKQGHTNVK